MIAEEESLKERLIKSITTCQKELSTLCSELHVEPFQVLGRVLGSCLGLRFRKELGHGVTGGGVLVRVVLHMRSGENVLPS